MSIIKNKREEKGLTQKEVADQLQLSQPAYFKIENGQTKIKGELKKKLMKILDLNETSINTVNAAPLLENNQTLLIEENLKLKSELKQKDEIIHFFIENALLSDRKQDFISSLWMYVQGRNMVKYPEKYKKIGEWLSQNDNLISEAMGQDKMPEDIYPEDIKKLDQELDNIRMYYIEKSMYESNIFIFLKENYLLSKTEIKHFNKFSKIDPKTVK